MIQFIAIGLYYLLAGYSALIFVYIILSWFPMLYKFSFFRLIHNVVDAYMGFFSGYLTIGMMDFTPIIGIVLFDALTYAYVWCLGF